MKALQINAVPYGSPCRIMLGIKKVAEENGIHMDTATGYSYHPIGELPAENISVGGVGGKLIHTWLAKLTGYNGCFSVFATWRLLKRIKKERYDLIHLHNIHGWYLNFPMLTRSIKKSKIKIVWTLHDCWAFTGQCPYYTMIGCEKWKTQCHACPQCNSYPATYVDRSEQMYRLKQKWFKNMDAILVTPSRWLAEQVGQSFLKDYPVRVIHNGIDLSVFRPISGDFREKYHCGQKKIILGVSLDWGRRKGLDVFAELAKRLPKDYQIVLVGCNEAIDRQLPDNIISIHRTQNQQELAEIYAAADVFVNPTREDNFPTVNIEALACGTPVITFATGGSPEIIDETCGAVVACDDVAGLEAMIRKVCSETMFSSERCRTRAMQFSQREKYQEYADLYIQLCGK